MTAGRPSELDEELEKKMKALFMDGKTWEEIATIIEIPIGTIESWKIRNYQGFDDRFTSWKLERRLKMAEKNLDKFLEMTTPTAKVMEIQADITKFVSETLGKRHYSKKVEQELQTDKPITFQIINYANPADAPVQLPATPVPATSNDSTGQREDQNNNNMAAP